MNFKRHFKSFLKSNSILLNSTIEKADQFDFEPLPLPNASEILHFETKKLGYLAEDFFETYLNLCPRYNSIKRNIQIVEEGITQGELDFIVEDFKRDQIIHLELAYKFYLWNPERGQGLDAWIGPNAKDRLDLKLEHFASKQIPLGQRIYPDLDSQFLILGQLYLPWKETFPSNTPLNSDAVSGSWINFNKLEELKDYKFYPIDKLDWFLEPEINVNWKSQEETKPLLEQKIALNKASCCWIKSPKGNLDKLFVVWW